MTQTAKCQPKKTKRDDRHENRGCFEARARFSMPEKRRQANLFSVHFRSSDGSLGDPMGLPKRSEDVGDDQFDLSWSNLMLLVPSHLGQTSSDWSFHTPWIFLGTILNSQTHPSGIKNNNNPLRTIAFSRKENQRLRCEWCLKGVLEHPGAPNRWRRGPREHPKGNQESPKRHRRATKSTRSEAKRVPKTTQKEAKGAIESSKAIFVKKVK